MQLVIAEKPSVAKSIAAVLGAGKSDDGYVEGNGYIVSWCVGHLVELFAPDDYDDKYKKYSFDTLPILPSDFKMKVSESTVKQYKVLKSLMLSSDIDEIVCATDAGREGECIFRYVYNLIGCHKPVKRLWISSVEDKAIRDGFKNLKDSSDFDNMFEAGFSRAKADWLVGMNFSRLFSCRYGGANVSVGRVQTPTLAMIVQRDYDVEHFVKQKFFTVELDCRDVSFSSARIDDESTANGIVTKCNGSTATVTNVEKTVKKVNPPKLYDLTTLQREANRQYGYTAQQTLDYTQSLYEKKLVTYPRTDSQFLTEDMENTALETVTNIYSAFPTFKPDSAFEPNVKRLINNSKVSDHHAIIPTAEILNTELDNLPSGEKNILLLISAKLVTATAPTHTYEAVKITVKCENTEFTATGKTVMEQGFKAVEKQIKASLKGSNSEEKEDEEKTLPSVSQGSTFSNVTANMAVHFTSSPKPFTEDTLLSAMETAGNSDYDENSDVEKKGLGTPATRASIIEGLVKKEFVERKDKKIIATEKGVALISALPEKVKSPKLTVEWETRLQSIEKGKESAAVFMSDIEDYVKEIVSAYSEVDTDSVLTRKNEVIGNCPKCGKNIVEMPKSYSCDSGKGCGLTIWKNISGKVIPTVTAKELLQNGKTGLIKGFVNKEKKTFDAVLKLDEDGKVTFEKLSEGSIGNCPKCGSKVVKGKFGYYCSGKCGMQLAKVYGKELSESQLSKLLLGKSVTYTNNKNSTTVLPEIEEYSFNGKDGFQWKTK